MSGERTLSIRARLHEERANDLELRLQHLCDRYSTLALLEISSDVFAEGGREDPVYEFHFAVAEDLDAGILAAIFLVFCDVFAVILWTSFGDEDAEGEEGAEVYHLPLPRGPPALALIIASHDAGTDDASNE